MLSLSKSQPLHYVLGGKWKLEQYFLKQIEDKNKLNISYKLKLIYIKIYRRFHKLTYNWFELLKN